MRLLIVTQKVDKDDPVLGFFCGWIQAFAKKVDNIHVIALEVGEYDMPSNVSVHSLGKKKGSITGILDRIKYAINFYKIIFRLRKEYDIVFVHMNQEYVLLAGLLWKIFGKKIMLWRNHAKGSFLTSIAVFWCNKVFCTSPSSYTARFKKTKIMPVGINTDFFKPDVSIRKIPRSILFLGRIAPVKGSINIF